MKIESMEDLKFVCELLWRGRDSYFPQQIKEESLYPQIKTLLKYIAGLDPENKIVYLEQVGADSADPEDRPLYTLWRIKAWENREGHKQRLHEEVVAAHHKSLTVRAKVAILTTKVRKVLCLGPMERSDFANMIASQAVVTNNKELLLAIGISAEELDEVWGKDIENPEEYL